MCDLRVSFPETFRSPGCSVELRHTSEGNDTVKLWTRRRSQSGTIRVPEGAYEVYVEGIHVKDIDLRRGNLEELVVKPSWVKEVRFHLHARGIPYDGTASFMMFADNPTRVLDTNDHLSVENGWTRYFSVPRRGTVRCSFATPTTGKAHVEFDANQRTEKALDVRVEISLP